MKLEIKNTAKLRASEPRLGLTFEGLGGETLNSQVQAWKLNTNCEK
jgi:hypothetical protein